MTAKAGAPPDVTARVVIADDHDVVRTGLRLLLEKVAGVRVVGEAADGQTLVDLALANRPDLVFTDIGMPGMDGMAAIARLRDAAPQMKVVVMSTYDDVEVVRDALAQGACGYLLKNAPGFEVADAVRTVMTTGRYFSASIVRAMLAAGAAPQETQLTERQLEILRWVALGKSSKEIAFELGLATKTVEMHRARLMQRLGMRDLPTLTRYAIKKGLIPP